MIVTFEEDYLCDLYKKGKTDDKNRRYQPQVIRKYRQCINLIRNIPNTNALKKYNGLNFENLQGDKQGRSSIRVNIQYRIEFTVIDTGVENIAKICNILDLSNHYK